MKSKYQECIEQWEPAFRVKSAFFKHRKEKRKYQDIFCIPVFIILALGLVAFQAYHAYQGYTLYVITYKTVDFFHQFPEVKVHATSIWITLIVLMFSNIFIILVTIILIGKYPQTMIKLLSLLTVITLFGLSIYFFITSQYAFGSILLFLFIIYMLTIFYLFQKYKKTCIIIIRVIEQILDKSFSYLFISIIVSFGGILAVGLLLISAARLLQFIALDFQSLLSPVLGEIYLLIHIFSYILILYFVYYLTTFLIGCSISNWYSKNSSYSLFTGLSLALFNHLGSITFAALIISPIKIMSTIIHSAKKNPDNMCAQICICFLKPCLSFFEGLIKTMNRYSIITIAFTGQSFIAGAKSAAVITFSNLKIIKIAQSIQIFFILSLCLLTLIWSVTICVIMGQILNLGGGIFFVLAVLVSINLLTSLISTSILTQTIIASCFYFLLHQKVKSYNRRLFDINKRVKQLFIELFIDNEGGGIQDSDDQVIYPRSRFQEKCNTAQKDQINQSERQQIIKKY